MPKLTIDGKEIEVAAGTTVIQAADKLGINIPRYCYHPALPVSGNCRICMVEIEKNPKLQIGCYTPVADGMVVHTTSPKVLEVRKTVLEFLLVNHPVDCPVCDQAGECKLQDYYMEHGRYNSRLKDIKVKKEKKAFSIGPTIMLDQERCILCTRCVRFTDTITKTNEFGVFQRGDHSQLDVMPGMQLDNNYSGNVADICPVGALTDKDFRFKCRVWYLEKTKSVCPGCSMGCNITVEWDKMRPRTHKSERVMRLKPRLNPTVNDYWMCDVGRYNYRPIDENRIHSPQTGEEFVTWEQAIGKIAAAIKPLKDGNRMGRVGVLASAQMTNEDLFVVRKLFRETLKDTHVDFRVAQKPHHGDHFLLKADRNPNTAGAAAIFAQGSEANTQDIINKAKNGELDVLYCLGHNLVDLYGKETVQQIAGKVKLFVYQGGNANDTCSYAHLNLPSSVYAEKRGTFTNFQKRVQQIWPAFSPIGESKADWEIISLIGAAIGAPIAYQQPEEIFKALSESVDLFAGLSYASIGDQGVIAGQPAPAQV